MDKAELLRLAKRVEGLTGPDRTVDEITLLVAGWTLRRAEELGERATWIDPSGKATAHRQGDGWFKPTASLDAALSLVPTGVDWILDNFDGTIGRRCAASVYIDQDWIKDVKAATPALALTAAALRAHASAMEGETS